MRLFKTQKVLDKITGDYGIVRTVMEKEKEAVVLFGEGFVKVRPYNRLVPLHPTVKQVRCISEEYDNFIYHKIYSAEATCLNEDGIPEGFEVIDEDGFEFPVLLAIFEPEG